MDVTKVDYFLIEVVERERQVTQAEMLELSMDMEADLGIDSIKTCRNISVHLPAAS